MTQDDALEQKLQVRWAELKWVKCRNFKWPNTHPGGTPGSYLSKQRHQFLLVSRWAGAMRWAWADRRARAVTLLSYLENGGGVVTQHGQQHALDRCLPAASAIR